MAALVLTAQIFLELARTGGTRTSARLRRGGFSDLVVVVVVVVFVVLVLAVVRVVFFFF